MEQFENNLNVNVGGEEEQKRTDKDFVPGFGAIPREQIIELAQTERVGNIVVDEKFDFDKLQELREAVEEYKKLGFFATQQELEDYNGFVRTIEKVLRAREKLKEEEEQVTQTLH